MAEKNVVTTPTPETNEALDKAKGFWANYSKPITYIGGAVIVLILGWYAYLNFVKLPNEKKANESVFAAEKVFDKMASDNFSKDSVNIVLNGGNLGGTTITGLLKVISNYSGTKAANRARYMTGACYLHIKEYDKAIKYLKEFDGNGADQVQSKANIMIGHAYAEQKKTEDALTYYKKAATVNEKDESITPDALMLAASYADFTGKSKDAIELYKKVKDKFPTYMAVSNGDVDKQLARLGVFN
jgi:tetratricopeptide (TPR) repeat protein